MTRLRGIPLGSNRATFEAFEQRIEDAALNRHLRDLEQAEAAEERRQERREG